MTTERPKILPECIQRFDRIDEKLDGLIARSDRINGRYDRHIRESVIYRRQVDKHDHLLKGLEKEKLNSVKASQWRIALIVSLVVSSISIVSQVIIRVFL